MSFYFSNFENEIKQNVNIEKKRVTRRQNRTNAEKRKHEN